MGLYFIGRSSHLWQSKNIEREHFCWREWGTFHYDPTFQHIMTPERVYITRLWDKCYKCPYVMKRRMWEEEVTHWRATRNQVYHGYAFAHDWSSTHIICSLACVECCMPPKYKRKANGKQTKGLLFSATELKSSYTWVRWNDMSFEVRNN